MQHKTTIYLPPEIKEAITREATSRGCSEAEVIRSALTTALTRPAPPSGIFAAEPFASAVDDHLTGFGDDKR